MFKFILPGILIGIALTAFFLFTSPLYQDVSLKRSQVSDYNKALDNAKAFEAERDKLTQKYNSFNPDNLSKLQKLLPDNVDNIRLILEIEKIASPYGMALKDVKYDAGENVVLTEGEESVPAEEEIMVKDYDTWNLEFSTSGSYSNFINFIKDLESNLRIVDISSIQFSSNTNLGAGSSLSEVYTYDFKIKTYWLKN
ncbi:MAG: hypothetical protein AAB873_02520 [Patescibacteria group bacterium]